MPNKDYFYAYLVFIFWKAVQPTIFPIFLITYEHGNVFYTTVEINHELKQTDFKQHAFKPPQLCFSNL